MPSFSSDSFHLFPLDFSFWKCHSVFEKVSVHIENSCKYLPLHQIVLRERKLGTHAHQSQHNKYGKIAFLIKFMRLTIHEEITAVGRWIESFPRMNATSRHRCLFAQRGLPKCPNICQTVTAVSWTSVASTTWPLWIIPPRRRYFGIFRLHTGNIHGGPI